MTLSVGEQRRRWIEATKHVAAGSWDNIRCPANDDDFLEIQVSEWRSDPEALVYPYRWLRFDRVLAETNVATVLCLFERDI